MSELIESVARALCRNDGRAPDMNWDEFVRPARAAVIATLKAIREPTETMVEAAYTGGGGVSDVYCAMIDALLKEKQEELMGKITISTPADGGDVQFHMSPEFVKTDLAYGWAITDRDNMEYEIVITYSPGQGGRTIWAVILTEIDMGMSHKTGQSKWSDAGEDISAAIREVTGHWVEPIND